MSSERGYIVVIILLLPFAEHVLYTFFTYQALDFSFYRVLSSFGNIAHSYRLCYL